MLSPEEEARNAVLRFYQALDDVLLGKGPDGMREQWHHLGFVTTVHPFGHWARGWTEVWATWQEVSAVFNCYRGHAGRQEGIGTIHDLRGMNVVGDMAYGVGVYKSVLYMPKGPMTLAVNCTDVVHRHDGAWKMVHHHADQAPPDYQAAVASLVSA
jgi:ketosteroid isomerase-like protein